MPEKRLPAIVDRAVWQKIAKGRTGIRWDNVVEKIWRDLGGYQEEVLSTDKFGGYKTELKERIYKGKVNAKKWGERGEALKDVRGVEGRFWNENVSARPTGLRKKAETNCDFV